MSDKKYIIGPERMVSLKADTPIRPFKNRHRVIESVRLEFLNLDEECEKDIKSNKGFYITNEKDFDEKKGVRTIDGLYSPLYGIDTFSDKITDDLYYCECGKTRNSINDGEICPYCGTPVKFADADLSITGYISLGKYSVINNGMYSILNKLIGAKDLNDIIKFNGKYNVNGINISTKTKKSPWHGIGLIEFKNQFDDIIEYYKEKRKCYGEYDLVKKYRDCVFTSNIPVYSALLRPLVKEGSKIGMMDVNRSFSIILANANNIRDDLIMGVDKAVVIENALMEIQTEYLNIYSDNIDMISSKKGIIRSSIICARVDSSGRAVIVPAIGHSVNEISLQYIAGCELLRPLLIRALNSMEGINIRDANTMIDNAMRKFSKKIWLLMNFIVKNSKNPPKVMVQRSPTLLQESMRFMDIKMIKADINDLTLDTPTGVLDGMNADYDGDTFAINMIFDNRLKDAWTPIHSPQYHFISRHTGEYSDFAKFIKDTSVTLCELWDLGKDCNYYVDWASDAERSRQINSISEC